MLRREAAWVAAVAAGCALGFIAAASCERKQPTGAAGAPAPAPAPPSEPPPDPAMAAAGEALFTRFQCMTCHSTDGTPGMGPTLAGIYGKRQKLEDGREVTVDIPYLHRSLVDPRADVVPGFSAQMLSYKGQMSEKDIAALVAYIRTLKPAEDEAP